MERRYAEWQRGRRPPITEGGCTAFSCLASIPLLCCAGGFLISALYEGEAWIYVVAGVLFIVSAGQLALLPGWWERRTGRRALTSRGADEGEAAVRVTVQCVPVPHAQGWSLGTDIGALCEESGWLIFRGERTEWAVRNSDVQASFTGLRFEFLTPEGQWRRVEIEPLTDPALTRMTLVEWRMAMPEAGTPVYPPAICAPEARRLLSPFAWISTTLFVGFLFLIGAPMAELDAQIVLALFALFCAGAVLSYGLARRRDLARGKAL